MSISRFPLAGQLAGFVFLTCVLIFSALVALISWMSNTATLRQVETGLTQQMSAIAAALDSSFAAAQDAAQRNMSFYKSMLPGKIQLAAGETHDALNQAGLPVLKAGDVKLNGNMELLEKVRETLKADPAVMVKQDGKFYRVTTFLKNKEGQSQEGVPLAPDGPETQSLNQGKAYYGMLNRNGKYYMSVFEPIIDANNQVVGAMSIRVDIAPIVARMTETLKGIRIGETGYAFVMAMGKELEDASFLVHPALAGKTLKELNKPAVTGVVRSMAEIKNGAFRYHWVDPKSNKEGEKIAAVAMVPGTNWMVGSGSWTDEFTVEADKLRNTLIGMVVFAAFMVIGMVVLVTRWKLAPIGVMARQVQAMGQGDLRQTFPATTAGSRSETDLLARSLAEMQQGMADMLGQIGQITGRIHQASGDLNASSQQVLSGSERQSSASSGLAASVEQLSVSVSQVSDNADEARRLAHEASEAARIGQSKVQGMVGDMGQIEGNIRDTAGVVHALGQKTSEITRVVQIIREIADQTNLLALNAAIEAARAGEAGRGFAVVADEVRKLAERTTQSTAEISSSIGAVQDESHTVVSRIEQVAELVSRGVSTAHEAGEVLNEIGHKSEQAVGAISGIAGSTREQSGATHVIASGVEEIAQMAETNTDAARNNQAAASHLQGIADDLSHMVARFRV